MVFINYNSSFLGVSISLLIAGSEIIDVLIGTNAGHLINYYGRLLYATLCIALIIFVFVAFNLIVLRDFSFERTITGIHEFQELDSNNIVV